MKMKVLVVICCLFFTQQVFAWVFPTSPTAKELYELIDDGKVLNTFSSVTNGGNNPSSTILALHPQYGLVTCFQFFSGITACTSTEK